MKPVQKHAQYYEAILQLRPLNGSLVDFILEELKKRPDIFISKKVEYKNGIDLYLSSNAFAKKLGQKLKKKFNGELKISRALYSTNRMTSKLLYRLTILFRLKE